jgi:hypothetical protein
MPPTPQADLHVHRLEVEVELLWAPVQGLAEAGLTVTQAQQVVDCWLEHGSRLAQLLAGWAAD